ncbi:MAG: ribonuclease P protein component [Clostridiales bacterium]|nr:ribonuclease P protein component [Clostridiales bacterium]
MKFTESLRRNCDFKKVYKSGRAKGGKYLIVFATENGLNINRLGISVSKKMGKAVRRNKFRRRIKEAYRILEPNFRPGLDIVILPKTELADAGFVEIKKCLKRLLEKHHG